jgi:hypothetical protein
MKTLIAKFKAFVAGVKAWVKDQWNKHGTKYLGSVTAFLGAVQSAALAGTLELEKGERKILGWLVVIIGFATVKRAVGSPPKTPPAETER